MLSRLDIKFSNPIVLAGILILGLLAAMALKNPAGFAALMSSLLTMGFLGGFGYMLWLAMGVALGGTGEGSAIQENSKYRICICWYDRNCGHAIRALIGR